MSSFKYLLLLLGILFQINLSISEENMPYLKESVNDEVYLYTLTSFYSEYINFPEGDEYPQTYQIEDGAECKMIIGSIIINEFGTIYPKNRTLYYYKNGTISEEFIPDLEIIKKDVYLISYGRSVVNCKNGAGEYNITFYVVDYSRTYAEKTLDDEVKAIIANEATQYKQFEKIIGYVSSICEYNSTYQSYIQLVIMGKGDSWATSSAIKYMADSAKIEAHMRYSLNDPNSQSELNVIAYIDNKFYISTILFDEELGKNSYSIKEISLGYSYYQSKEDENKIVIYQYDGYDENITIPEKIDEKTVVGLDKKCFANGVRYSGLEIKSITIPNTVTSIGDNVFSELNDIEKIEIPKSVKTIGNNVFVSSRALKEIIVDKDNENYISENGILFDKKKEILIAYPCNKEGSVYNVKENVTKISDYSFYQNLNLLNISIPSSVKQIGKGAFGDAELLEEITFNGEPPLLGNDSFLYLEIKLKYPKKYSEKWKTLIKEREDELGFFDIELEEFENDDDNDDGESNTLLIVLIIIGVIIILCAVIFIFLLKRRKNTSTSIDTIGGEGLMSDRNEIAL